MMSEQWREISGHPYYEVSDLGRVRSWKGRTPRILKPSSSRGYLYVGLSHDGKTHTRLVHRLALTAFRGEAPAEMECCHYDGNPSNNCLLNLRWDTRAGNDADSIRNGTRGRRIKRVRPKLTEEQVREIRASDRTQRAIALAYGVSLTSVSRIKKRKSWAWLSE